MHPRKWRRLHPEDKTLNWGEGRCRYCSRQQFSPNGYPRRCLCFVSSCEPLPLGKSSYFHIISHFVQGRNEGWTWICPPAGGSQRTKALLWPWSPGRCCSSSQMSPSLYIMSLRRCEPSFGMSALFPVLGLSHPRWPRYWPPHSFPASTAGCSPALCASSEEQLSAEPSSAGKCGNTLCGLLFPTTAARGSLKPNHDPRVLASSF